MSIPFGRYELLKKLAAGGMGQVFLARKKGVGFEKLVVLKTILPHLVEDEEFFTMFLDEAKLTARLNHPNIAQIFDVEVEQNQHFVVMEYVQGEDVRRVEKRSRAESIRIPLGVILRVIADAAAGLHYAHTATDDTGVPMGIVHRDISPQNILVGFDGGVKVIDFGVAKAAGRLQHTATGVLKGKFPYMSPEQADGQDLDARSDIFALGIVLWEMLCDRRLFKGDNDLASQRLVKAAAVPAPSSIEPSLSPALDAIVLKALAKNRDDRFADAGEFRHALEAFAHEAHQQASSSHLSTFMRKLYVDRISELSDISKMDELQPGSDLSGMRVSPAMATPNHKSQVGRAPHDEQGVATVRSKQTDVVKGARNVQVAEKKSKGPLIGIAAFVLVLIGAATVFALTRTAAPTQPGPIAVVPTQTAKPVEPLPVDKPVEKPAPLAITVSSEPSGADVELAGQRVGVTPMPLVIERTNLPAVLRVTREGYEAQSTTITEASGSAQSLTLEKKKIVKRPGGGTRPDIKTSR